MKRNEITIGGVYRAKVSDKLTDVRIDQENPAGGWNATNLATGKNIRIKGAQRLRAQSNAKGKSTKNATSANTGKSKLKATKDAKPAAKRDTAKRGGPTAKKKAIDEAQPKRTSGLDAAAQVLAKSKKPLTCKEIVEVAIEQKLWSPGGKTPHATIYSAIIREIANKGNESRFRKADRGKFELAKEGA